MERLSYIELLCLRVSEGLGSERDVQRLRKAGINPEDWMGFTSLLRSALRPPPSPDFSSDVCTDLAITQLPLRAALSPRDTRYASAPLPPWPAG